VAGTHLHKRSLRGFNKDLGRRLRPMGTTPRRRPSPRTRGHAVA
jgi:hypothetical protein